MIGRSPRDLQLQSRAMDLEWEKLGLVFSPSPSVPWMRSHASAPTALHLSGDVYRVFFSSRDADNRSHVGYFDIELADPIKVLKISDHPVLVPGPLGWFDDHGVYATSAVKAGRKVFLFTIGWNPGPSSPLFYSSIGLAVSRDGGNSFEKFGRSPILARSDHDPCLVTAPMVLKEGERWRMWYVSGIAWERVDQVLHSRYHIKYAESTDGIRWQRDGVVCIDFADAGERNIGRTCVLKSGDRYHAWFSFDRGDGYRIGYATSPDGIKWDRHPEWLGLGPSGSSWESEAVAYPYVVRHRGRLFMFYNGNRFGRDGVGLAVGRHLPTHPAC
jgi:hypothetical protein